MKAANKVIRKLHSRAGTSLAEMLCCTLILLLVSGGMATGISVAVRQYQSQRELSNGKLLFSTLQEAITAELRYTGTVVTANPGADSTEVLEFYSRSYSSRDSLSSLAAVDEDGYITDYGELMLGDRNTGTDTPFSGLSLISSASYADGLQAGAEILCNCPEETFTVTLTIVSRTGEVLVSEEFDVQAVNELTITAAE